MIIDLAIKKHCVELSEQGQSNRQIYDEYFSTVHTGMSFETFRHKIRIWKHKTFADNSTLNAGTYAGFVSHNATVQVNGNGEVVQAWIKQQADGNNLERFAEIVQILPKVDYIEPIKTDKPSGMLEIPLFDIHFGINDLEYYRNTLNDTLLLIESKKWESIHIIVGQDLFHNNDFRGRTAKGTPIQTVDMEQAFIDARDMYFSIIRKAIQCAMIVNVNYSEGNHDESVGWFFFQVLKQAFEGQAIFDDSREPRKCIHWNNIFIGFGHCDDGRTSPQDIRCQFTIEFPIEFAHSTAREIHLGHLHTERKRRRRNGR